VNVPRKVVLDESKAFYLAFERFWEIYSEEFRHVKLEHVLFLKDEEHGDAPHEECMEIRLAPREMRLALPEVRFVLIVHTMFNNVNNAKRDFYFYNCLFQIPRDYTENLRLKKPDFVSFFKVMEKFKNNIEY
jgi:hypothetical protein